MTTATLPVSAVAAPVLDGAAVRAACNRVKFAAGDAYNRFGRADGVMAIRDGAETLFIATDGTSLALLRVPGVLEVARAFFPLPALIGSGKRATRGMPKADPMLPDAGHSYLSAGVLEVALRAESGRGAALYFEPEEFDAFARRVRSAGTDSVRLEAADGFLFGHGGDAVVLEFDVLAEVSDSVGEFPRTYLCPKRLGDAVRKMDDGPERVSLVSVPNPDDPKERPIVAVRQAGFTVALAPRSEPKPEGGAS